MRIKISLSFITELNKFIAANVIYKISKVIRMSEKVYVLDEAVVMPYDRIELLTFFHDRFFGNMWAAQYCIINNPDVLKFKFEQHGGMSVATYCM